MSHRDVPRAVPACLSAIPWIAVLAFALSGLAYWPAGAAAQAVQEQTAQEQTTEQQAADPDAAPDASGADASAADDEALETDVILAAALQPWQGDLDEIAKRGYLRIIIPNDPMFLAYDGDRLVGLAAEAGEELEKFLRQKLKAQIRPIFMPMGRDRMIPALIDGRADVIAANLTVTPERAALVAFADPMRTDVREIVVTGPAAGPVASFDDLVPTGIAVRASSSYYTHLQALNQTRAAAGEPEIPLETVDELLEDYDLIDMVQSGLLSAIVVDDHKARFWAQVFAGVTLHEDLAVNEGGAIAWAVRPNAPKLLAALNDFVPDIRKGSMLGNVLTKRYFGSTKWLERIDSAVAGERFLSLVDHFRTFAGRYDLDWMLMAAQGYQELQLDQSVRSRVGAIGVMQIMPSTARDAAVGIPDISNVENNIHAGTKYVRFLRTRYFDDPAITSINQIFFALAAYNAGPGNIAKARKKAAAMGLDPNIWFDNVEVAAGKAISREPVTYVRNIVKYAVFFRLALEAAAHPARSQPALSTPAVKATARGAAATEAAGGEAKPAE